MFNNAARRVRDFHRPLGQRYGALMWALESYAFLTRQSFNGTLGALRARHGFSRTHPATEAQLLAALADLERARKAYLTGLQAFASRRVREKAQGRRQPSRADLEQWGAWRPFSAPSLPPGP